MQIWSLEGIVSYDQVRDLQLELVELRHQGLIPDTLLFLEHEPVITRGKGLQWTGVPRPRHMPFLGQLPKGITFAESERGGDLTFHGPGQLVIYPIFKLDGQGFAPSRDIVGFLRKLEQVVIQSLAEKNLVAHTRENATGIWLEDKKVASIGIAVRKWISYHGIAINCVNDLSPFHLISPCGYNPEIMTRLLDRVPLGEDWRQELEELLVKQLAKYLPKPLDLEPIQYLKLDAVRDRLKDQRVLCGSSDPLEKLPALSS